MSDNIVKLEVAQRPVVPVDQATVEYLEIMLERARQGEIQGVAMVTVESTGAGTLLSCGTGWAGEGLAQNVHAAIGAASHLHARLLGRLETPI